MGCTVCGCRPTDSTAVVPQGVVGEASSPTVSDYAIWRPFFFTDFGNQAIDEIRGTAFAVKIGPDNKVYLLTSLSLLGPTGGLTRQIEPGQIRKLVTEVVIGEAFGATDSNFTLKLPVEPSLEVHDIAYWMEADVLLLPTESSKARFRPLGLAAQAPKQGDTIWLATAVFGGAPASQTTHEATVLDAAEDGSLRYAFANLSLKLDAAQGAPLVDATGQVVGMHQVAITDDADSSADTSESTSSRVEGKGISIAKLREAIERLLPH